MNIIIMYLSIQCPVDNDLLEETETRGSVHLIQKYLWV